MTPDIGDRIRLIHTNDRYTKIKHGDLGSITDVIYLPEDYGGQAQIWAYVYYLGVNLRRLWDNKNIF